MASCLSNVNEAATVCFGSEKEGGVQLDFPFRKGRKRERKEASKQETQRYETERKHKVYRLEMEISMDGTKGAFHPLSVRANILRFTPNLTYPNLSYANRMLIVC